MEEYIDHMMGDPFSILIVTLQGLVIMLAMRSVWTIGFLKQYIHGKTRIPPATQVLRYRGKFLEDSCSLNDSNIIKNSTLHMSTILCGGIKDKGCYSAPKNSYKYISQKTTSPTPLPQAYIVERTKKTSWLELTDPRIEGIHDAYVAQSIICRFNGICPKNTNLYKWINTSWTQECDISLCSKGFLWFFFIILKTTRQFLNLVPGFGARKVSLSLHGFHISTQINYQSPEHQFGSDCWIYPFISGFPDFRNYWEIFKN